MKKNITQTYGTQVQASTIIPNQHSSKDGQHLSQTPPEVGLDVRFQWHDATHDPMLWHLCREHLSDSVDAGEAGIKENSAWAGVTFTFYISSSIAPKYQRSALLNVQHLPSFSKGKQKNNNNNNNNNNSNSNSNSNNNSNNNNNNNNNHNNR